MLSIGDPDSDILPLPRTQIPSFKWKTNDKGMEGCLVLILVQTAWRISKIHEEVLVALKIVPNCDVATYVRAVSNLCILYKSY